MLGVSNRPKEPRDFLKAQSDQELSGLLGTNDIFNDPLLAQGDPVEELQSRIEPDCSSSRRRVAPG